MRPLSSHPYGDRGPWLVMGHGFMLNHSQWFPVLPALTEHARCLLVDMPGFGSSPHDAAPRGEEHEALRLALDERGIDTAIVVGFSFSGPVAVSFALTFPRATSALVLVSTAMGGGGRAVDDARREERRRWLDVIERDGLLAWADSMSSFSPPAASATRARELREILSRNDRRDVAALLRSMVDVDPHPSLSERLFGITCPTLVLAGERDAAFVAVARAVADAIPTAEFASLPRAGHMCHLDEPDAFVDAVVSFLRRHDLLE